MVQSRDFVSFRNTPSPLSEKPTFASTITNHLSHYILFQNSRNIFDLSKFDATNKKERDTGSQASRSFTLESENGSAFLVKFKLQYPLCSIDSEIHFIGIQDCGTLQRLYMTVNTTEETTAAKTRQPIFPRGVCTPCHPPRDPGNELQCKIWTPR